MAKALKIKGVQHPFLSDWKVMDGLYKTDKRPSIRSNVKKFKIKLVKANSKDNMGVGFTKLDNCCIINFDVPSGSNLQLLVSRDLDLEKMQDFEGLNDTYKKLIKTGHDIASGINIEEEKKGVFKKIIDAIF